MIKSMKSYRLSLVFHIKQSVPVVEDRLNSIESPVLTLAAFMGLGMAHHTWRDYCGIGGIHSAESTRIKHASALFETVLLLVAFWLPIQWYFEVTHEIVPQTAAIIDWWIWLAFVMETLILTALVKHKLHYLATNWLNLLLIVLVFPIFWQHVPYLATLRAFRILVILRLILPWFQTTRSFLSTNHLGLTLLITIFVTCLSGLILSAFDPGIHGPLQGIWWAWETVTTVGYGDVAPTTPFGKVIAIFVMLLGLGFVSLLTANLSAFFIGQDKHAEKQQRLQSLELLNSLHDQLEELNTRLKNLEHNAKRVYDETP